MNLGLSNKINKLLQKDKGPILSYEGLEVKVNGGNPVTDLEIYNINHQFEKKIPSDYIEFLKLCNGLELYNYDDLDGFKLLSVKELIEQNQFQKENYGEDLDNSIIFFCESIGEGNFLGFKIIATNKYVILDCFHEEAPSEWKVIGNSFDDFIEKLIDAKGEKFWLKGI